MIDPLNERYESALSVRTKNFKFKQNLGAVLSQFEKLSKWDIFDRTNATVLTGVKILIQVLSQCWLGMIIVALHNYNFKVIWLI